MRRFVLSFIDEPGLKAALRRNRASAKFRHPILQKFNFVHETYGHLSDEEIMTDLEMLLLVLAKRYKQCGRNFCAYLYNAYCFEASRHIKKFIKDPSNIHYRNVEYEDYMQTYIDKPIEDCFEDKIYENNVGLPDITWINGESCSDEFQDLTNVERKLLIKYYLEDYNDRQIADELGTHINTINQRRRHAVGMIACEMGYSIDDVKRNRKSGKKALYYSKLEGTGK